MTNQKKLPHVRTLVLSAWIALGVFSTLGIAAHAQTGKPLQPALPAIVWGVTVTNELIQFDAAAPRKIVQRKAITGLAAGDAFVGADFRVSRGVLFGLTRQGRLYTINTATGETKQVGSAALSGLQGQVMGFDFNPVADRIRVVSANGQNLRLHPETGAQVDFDPKVDGVQPDPSLAFAADDRYAGKQPDVVAAGYTYNKANEKLTTNYAIDRSLGALLMQGSHEDAQPVVSPNLGQLHTVGDLGLGPLEDASFDIADIGNVPLAAVRTTAIPQTRLVKIDLKTGHATVLGLIGTGESLAGLAIEP